MRNYICQLQPATPRSECRRMLPGRHRCLPVSLANSASQTTRHRTPVHLRALLLTYMLMLGTPLAIPAPASADDRAVREEFLRHYEPHAERIQHYYSNIQLKYRDKTFAGHGLTVFSSGEAKYDLLRFVFIIETGTSRTGEPPTKTTKKVYGRNGAYAFQLQQKEQDPYVVTGVTIHRGSGDESLAPFNGAYADINLAQQSFLEMARHNTSVRFIGCDDCVWQGKSMKELKIEWTGKKSSYATGYYLSPEDGWICCGKWQQQLGSGSKYREQVWHYAARHGEEFPAIQQIESWEKDRRDPANSKLANVCDITDFKHCAPFPDSDFKLSAFGFPEPQGLEGPKSSKIWLWLLLAAVAAAALYVVFARLKRRQLRTVP
jgi:hypothetical protein